MPILAHSSYVPPRLLANGHCQTVLASLFRKVSGVTYQRERITTPDGDFLDLDWACHGARRIAVIAHGLEGDSQRGYARGMVRALSNNGWDAVVWNARGCSGEINRSLRFTHSGATEDLQAALSHLTATRDYDEIALMGFSLGGNITLKYLGDQGQALDPRIQTAVAFSVPCDLRSGALELAKGGNRIYMQSFLRSLRQKIRARMKTAPGEINDDDYENLRTFQDFDDRYTAPIHGFADAEDYWRKCSCRPVLNQISIPTLLVNARNDPFLGEDCYPVKEAETNPHLLLEMPSSGGHVGFMNLGSGGEYWSETRALSFLENSDSSTTKNPHTAG